MGLFFNVSYSQKYNLHHETSPKMKAATIRLPDCPWQSLFGLGNHDLQKNCPIGQVQIRR